MTLVIAHRGASAYEVENSLAAFRAASAMGADGVELDVQLTADDVPVVHHDPVAGGYPIAKVSRKELLAHQLPNGERVPTLGDALAVLGSELNAYVEVKSLSPRQDASLFAVLDRGPAPAHYQVHSFDHRIVRRLLAQRSDLSCGLLSCSYPLRPFVALDEVGAGVLWQHEAQIDRDLVRQAHEGAYQVFAWTVDDRERMQELLGMGIDALCSNRPDLAREVVG